MDLFYLGRYKSAHYLQLLKKTEIITLRSNNNSQNLEEDGNETFNVEGEDDCVVFNSDSQLVEIGLSIDQFE